MFNIVITVCVLTEWTVRYVFHKHITITKHNSRRLVSLAHLEDNFSCWGVLKKKLPMYVAYILHLKVIVGHWSSPLSNHSTETQLWQKSKKRGALPGLEEDVAAEARCKGVRWEDSAHFIFLGSPQLYQASVVKCVPVISPAWSHIWKVHQDQSTFPGKWSMEWATSLAVLGFGKKGFLLSIFLLVQLTW